MFLRVDRKQLMRFLPRSGQCGAVISALAAGLIIPALIAFPASAQSGNGGRQVTLAEAVTMAEAMNFQGKLVELELLSAAEGVKQAKGQRRPRVTLTMSYTQTQQNIISQDNKTFQKGKSRYPVADVALTITQPLYDAVRFRELPLAQAEEALTRARGEAALDDVARQLVGAYIQVALAQTRVREAETIRDARKRFTEDVASLVESGRADRDELLRAQGDIIDAERNVADAESELAQTLFELQRFTGVGVSGVRADGRFAMADPRSMRGSFGADRLEDLNPDIQIAKAELAVAEKRMAQVQAQLRPVANFKLESSYNQSRGSLFGGGSTVSSVDAGVEVTWSLYEGGVRRSQLRVAQNEVEAAKIRIDQARELSKAHYETLVEALEQSVDIVSVAAEEQRLADERVKAADEKMAAGTGSIEAVLEAGLRRDVAEIAGLTARMRVAQIQAEIFALFGAVDTAVLSRDYAGG